VKGDIRPRPLVLLGDFWSPVLETTLTEASSSSRAGALRSCVRVVAGPAEAAAAALDRHL
jgi:hypothetical protein